MKFAAEQSSSYLCRADLNALHPQGQGEKQRSLFNPKEPGPSFARPPCQIRWILDQGLHKNTARMAYGQVHQKIHRQSSFRYPTTPWVHRKWRRSLSKPPYREKARTTSGGNVWPEWPAASAATTATSTRDHTALITKPPQGWVRGLIDTLMVQRRCQVMKTVCGRTRHRQPLMGKPMAFGNHVGWSTQVL